MMDYILAFHPKTKRLEQVRVTHEEDSIMGPSVTFSDDAIYPACGVDEPYPADLFNIAQEMAEAGGKLVEQTCEGWCERNSSHRHFEADCFGCQIERALISRWRQFTKETGE